MDRITGFEGIAVSRIEYLNGCIRYGVQPVGVDKDGKMFSQEWVDSQQIVILGGPDIEAKPEPTGGPGITPPKDTLPSF
jgi:hypothetical protein